MQYDFNKICSRRGTGSIKWDLYPMKTNHPDPLPMWIADMDIPTPDFVVDAMRRRLDHPMFGYFKPDERFYSSIIRWHRERYGVGDLKEANISYQHSVLGALSSAVEAFTVKGEGVLVQTPGYAKFREIIEMRGRRVVKNPLIWDGATYRLDFEDMERKIVEEKIRLAVFCSPHNPTGRGWTREELETYAEICLRHGVLMVSDEIWADFSRGEGHIPLHSVSEEAKNRTISFYSPTKAVDLAGLVISYGVICDAELMRRFQAQSNLSHYNNCNALSMEASIAAYSQGGEWVDALNCHIGKNTEYVYRFIQENMPGVRTWKAEGTYLMWLDFSGLGLTADEVVSRCCSDAGVLLNDGRTCIDDGDCCMRMNVAAPESYVREGMERLRAAFF